MNLQAKNIPIDVMEKLKHLKDISHYNTYSDIIAVAIKRLKLKSYEIKRK